MIVAVILAAGLSSRMKKNKLLLPLGETTVIEHVVKTVLSSKVDYVVVVSGRDHDFVRKLLKYYPIRLLYNDQYEKGQSTSIIKGMETLPRTGVEGVLFAMGDQPLITVEGLNTIIDAFALKKGKIIVPINSETNKKGAPVLFDRSFFSEIKKIEGDQGGKVVIRQFPDEVFECEIQSSEFFDDIDTEEAYEAIIELWRRHETIDATKSN